MRLPKEFLIAFTFYKRAIHSLPVKMALQISYDEIAQAFLLSVPKQNPLRPELCDPDTNN